MIVCYSQRGEDQLTSQQLHEKALAALAALQPKMSLEDWQTFFNNIEAIKTVARFMYGRVTMNASDLVAFYNRLTERNFWDKCPGCGE